MWIFGVCVTILLICSTFGSCESNCASATTCHDCIGLSFECEWCSAKIHSGSRCQAKSYRDTKKDWCSEKVYNPTISDITYSENDPINTGANGSKIVQLKPQKMKIKLRPGHLVNFTVKYRPYKDYPLDVYYLMDYSYTMKSYLTLLQSQGTKIYEHLSNITNNVQLGVGSFVEKPGLPFANPFQNSSYAFRNHLPLTNNTENFRNAIRDSETGANLDDPEASLDALMQAMVCKERIGWRERARKIIVLCTDSTYHSAGDGKMAGAAKLNDMQCHLDDKGYYNVALEQDYPTVNQINKIAIQENTFVIFNTLAQVKREYMALTERIQDASYVELKYDSDIVEIITNEYKKSVSNLQMDVVKPNNIHVKLTPDCTKAACPVKYHEDLTISVSVTAESCVTGHNVVTIQPMGLGETLKIQVETFCECECEKNGIPNATECSGKGSFQCGTCICNENSSGEICQCTGDSMVSEDQSKCFANINDTVVCSGHGICRCGTCDHSCDYGFSGAYCQYNDNSCAHTPRGICNGKGTCQLNQCQCHMGWTGNACQCSTDTYKCRDPHSEGVCSGNGDCICETCICTRVDSANKIYTGPFCENCFDCDEKRCKNLEKYVLCVYFKDKDVCDEEFKTSGNVVEWVNSTEINAPQYHLAKLCKVVLEDGKSIVFKHMYKVKTLHLIIQKDLEEPDRANMWIAIASSIGGIILLGLLAVIAWKVLMDIHDAREYEKFKRMLDEPADVASDNPLFENPVVKFRNPAYKRRSRNSRMH